MDAICWARQHNLLFCIHFHVGMCLSLEQHHHINFNSKSINDRVSATKLRIFPAKISSLSSLLKPNIFEIAIWKSVRDPYLSCSKRCAELMVKQFLKYCFLTHETHLTPVPLPPTQSRHSWDYLAENPPKKKSVEYNNDRAGKCWSCCFLAEDQLYRRLICLWPHRQCPG